MRFVRHEQLKPEYGIVYTRTHIARLEKAGKFPKRVRMADRGDHYAYIDHELEAYIEARMAAREAA